MTLEELAELSYQLHYEQGPVKRANLRAQIARLTPQGPPGAPSTPKGDSILANGLTEALAAPEPAPQSPPTPEDVGWHTVARLPAGRFLGIT